jgi:hypothetical protein
MFNSPVRSGPVSAAPCHRYRCAAENFKAALHADSPVEFALNAGTKGRKLRHSTAFQDPMSQPGTEELEQLRPYLLRYALLQLHDRDAGAVPR